MKDSKKFLWGYLLVMISAISFSAKGIFAKFIYAHGVDPTTLLALRFAMTMPLFWATLYFYPSPRMSGRDVAMVAIIGLTGFYAAAMLDFQGLVYVDATIERIIIYTYPAVVVVLASLFLRERMTARKAASVALTWGGLVLSLKVWSGTGATELAGAGMVFGAAVIYSVSYIMMEVLGRRVSGVKISTWATTVAGFAFIGTWHFSSFPGEPVVWLHLALLAVVSTYLPILTLLLGIKRIGAAKAALTSFIGPISTAVLAGIFLGERVDAVQILGMAVVISGVLLITGKGKKAPAPRP